MAVGSKALENNITGDFNMAIGTEALTNNNASFNLAIGFRVGFMNTTGRHLTGIGAAALRNNTTASFNTAIGADALRENTIGEKNTAIGADALAKNTIAEENTATGAFALSSNTEGDFNTANGAWALFFNTTPRAAANDMTTDFALRVHLFLHSCGNSSITLWKTKADSLAPCSAYLANNYAGFGEAPLGLRDLAFLALELFPATVLQPSSRIAGLRLGRRLRST